MPRRSGPAARLVSLEADWKWALVAKRFVWQAAQGEKRSKAVSPNSYFPNPKLAVSLWWQAAQGEKRSRAVRGLPPSCLGFRV